MRTFAVGDIHGGYKALKQVLGRAEFDYENDKLIVLGDVADGWPEVPECIEELLKIKHLVPVMGNHDYWALQWLELGQSPHDWTLQGGQATLDAYVKRCPELMVKHREEYFKKLPYYYIDEENRVFVHGGFYRGIDIKTQLFSIFMWDRSLAEKAVNGAKVHEFKEVYLGHTTVNSLGGRVEKDKPFWKENIYLLDTGAGWEGVLTMMNIDTKEYFQSDVVASLYPNIAGRSGKKWKYMTRNF